MIRCGSSVSKPPATRPRPRSSKRPATPRRPWAIRSNVVASQVAIHREWGGVVPELASRQHIRDICGVVERALIEAESTWRDLGAVAVTQGPGLVGSLLVGVSFAKAAAAAAGLPLVAVHHLAGHIESLVLQNGELPLPSVVLVVSGGHTSLYLVERPGSYQLLEPDAGRCGGRGVRQGGQAARPRLSRRAGDRSAREERQRSRRRAADHAADARRSQRAGAEGRSRLQLQRPEDRGAAARSRARERSRCPIRRSPTSPPASSASSSAR